MDKQKGYISILLILFVVGAAIFYLLGDKKNFSGVGSDLASGATTVSCRPEESNIPVSLVADEGRQNYRLIKSRILIQRQFVETPPGGDPNEDHMNDWGAQIINGENFYIYTPKPDSKTEGFPYRPNDSFTFTHVDFNGKGFVFASKKESILYGVDNREFWFFDVYLKVGQPIPADISTCQSMPDTAPYVTIAPTLIPVPSANADNKQLQLGTFKFTTLKLQLNNWWTPACKPVIYLYPEKIEEVLVKLAPKGFLLETIPKYPEEGWFVNAYPDGKIAYKDKTYDYLYYESKIRDEEINIPKDGFVVAFPEIENLLRKIMPKTGLNEKESKEFIDYWKKALPKSPYYFIGLMEENNIEKIEPLTIFPKPTTIIRVRFYFKALDKKIEVLEPVIERKVRNGFTVVEWGGMVKTDKNHPFTCSQ